MAQYIALKLGAWSGVEVTINVGEDITPTYNIPLSLCEMSKLIILRGSGLQLQVEHVLAKPWKFVAPEPGIQPDHMEVE